MKQQQLAGIGREKVQPVAMAQRVLPRILYGEGHAYSNPLTGSGTERSVGEMGLDALRAFHDTWFRPNNATLIVVGDRVRIEEKIRALGLGPMRFLDADGNPVQG